MKATYNVRSWSELADRIEETRSTGELRCRKGEELWFRGVSQSSHKLLPSLHRCVKNANKTDLDNLEYDLYFEFLAKARTQSGSALDEWDVLFMMQHYRAPTRLLDWTEVLFVAAHFAVAYRTGAEKEPPRVWVMNPYVWNERNHPSEVRDLQWPQYFGWDEELKQYYGYGEILVDAAGVDWPNPVAFYPPQRDARLSAQRGYFTIHGTDPRPLEEIAPELLVSIDLTPRCVREAERQLELAGINEFSLFPDLEGLSRYLKRKYRID